jgi:hypothetical protein
MLGLPSTELTIGLRQVNVSAGCDAVGSVMRGLFGASGAEKLCALGARITIVA